MPFNGSGVFQRVRNWVADATAGIKIRADYHDAEDDGFVVVSPDLDASGGVGNPVADPLETLIR